MAAAKKRKLLFTVLFLAYLVLLVYFLFFSEKFGRTGSNETYQYNLVIFQEIRRFVRYREIIGTTGFLLNIFGNVVAFMPFGFFLPIVSRRGRRWYNAFLLGFFLSLCIETTQLIFQVGSFDVDDLLLNTIGGILGFLCYKKVQGIRVRRKRRAAEIRETPEDGR